MQSIINKLKDSTYAFGLITIIISFSVFSLPMYVISGLNSFNIFVINFLLAGCYFVVLLLKGRLKKGREGLIPLFLLLILFLISAYSLNRKINVFEASGTWLSATLIIVCINYILFIFFDTMPGIVKYVMCFVLGVGCCLFLYLSIYLVPLYLLSAAGFFLLGISLHTFVPLLLLLYSIKLFRRVAWSNLPLRISYYAGTASVAVVVIAFVSIWSQTTSAINKTYRYATAINELLPAWVNVAQKIPANSFTEKIFKTSLVYSVPDNTFNNFLWQMPMKSFGEQKVHDPLVMTASLVSGRMHLEDNDRIKILESQYDSRHQAQERLWSGENLITDYVNTHVRVWPQFSISFTEKTITVSNLSNRADWSLPEEAIYTFHLPEGGLVSALSLWINGKEEKGLLTTTEKAATAYRTIVGVESRDPSVVHWQEGNTVSVRVYPVNSGSSRTFKIGITAPLQKIKDKLVYTNIYFDGPSPSAAREDVLISFDHKLETPIRLASLKSLDKQHYQKSGRYLADWSVTFPYVQLSAQGFSFEGKIYSVSPYEPKRSSAAINDIYLDLNSSWTKNDFENVYNIVKDKNVYVYNDGLMRVAPDNKNQLFNQLSALRFSLFPLFKIKNPASALIISKSTKTSPGLSDLNESAFLHKTKEYLIDAARIKLFNMGSDLSPYLKTLLEYRVFNSEQGDAALLQRLIKNNVFAVSQEDSNHVVISNAHLMITESKGEILPEAPDHLMRLYAYNHIMQNAGKRLLNKIPEDDELVKEAKAASIVSPVSSLVVLESQKDYDRFNILENKDSLGNASLKSKGSVPEPHEWLLIFIALSVFVCIKYKHVISAKLQHVHH